MFLSHKQCTGCGACLNVCPIDCISMELDNEKFFYPNIDKTKCIDCKKCAKACPVMNRQVSMEEDTTAFAVAINDEHIRYESSSGGAFSLIANQIISKGG